MVTSINNTSKNMMVLGNFDDAMDVIIVKEKKRNTIDCGLFLT